MTPIIHITRLALAALLAALCGHAAAIGTDFTYQGHLTDADEPAQGAYDLRFTLLDAPNGSPVGAPQTRDDVSVFGGVFTVSLDFGDAAFTGADRFLMIEVRRGAENGAYTTLNPRSAILPAPYAQVAADAEVAASVASSSVTTVGLANLAVTSAKLADTSVTTAKLANAAVTAAKLANASVGTSQINAAQVQRRITGFCAANTAMAEIAQDGSVTCIAVDGGGGGSGWGLTGNAGTNPASHFLGTTDNQPLALRVNNVESLRVVPGFYSQMSGGDTISITAPSLVANGNRHNEEGFGNVVLGGGQYAINGTPVPDVDDLYANRILPGALSAFVTIAGGSGNRAGGFGATIGGGQRNTANGSEASVGGGNNNEAGAFRASIGGGGGNRALANYASIGGGINNSAYGNHASIGGGSYNVAVSDYGSIGGGYNNCAGGTFSWAGGHSAKVRKPSGSPVNTEGCGGVSVSGDADGDEGSFVWADAQGLGFSTTGPNQFAVRAAGGLRLNRDTSLYFRHSGTVNHRQMLNLEHAAGDTVGSIGIGTQPDTLYQRSATQFAWFRGGTHSNTALEPGAGGTRLMSLDASDLRLDSGVSQYFGNSNRQMLNLWGTVSAIGVQDATLYQRSPTRFAWFQGGTHSDTALDPGTGGTRLLSLDASGLQLPPPAGIGFGTGFRQMLNLYSTTYGLGVQSNTLYMRTNNAFAWYYTGTHSDTAGDPGTGQVQMSLASNGDLTVRRHVNAVQFNTTSDRNAKSGFAPVDPLDVLARVLELPVSEWAYKGDETARHIGPMAQDFHAAFGFNGEDDTHIATVDADGVALAAIQGLNTKLEAEVSELHEKLAALHEELAALRPLLTERRK